MRIWEIDAFISSTHLDESATSRSDPLIPADPQLQRADRSEHPGGIASVQLPSVRGRRAGSGAADVVIVRLETDTGLVGWGEAHTPLAPALGDVIEVLAPVVHGRDPLEVDPIWESMRAAFFLPGHEGGFLTEAMSAIDIAIWDLAGKALGCPVAKLLGGRIRDRVPVYASDLRRFAAEIDRAGDHDVAAVAAQLVDEGYRAIEVELGLGPEHDRECLRALRKVVGRDIGLIVDMGGAYDLALARRAGRAMEEEGALWITEPLMHAELTSYARLAESLTIAVGGAPRPSTRWSINEFLAAGALDLVQPNVARTGGISEAKRISDLADSYSVPFSPRLGSGSAICRAASLQWAAAGPNLRLCGWPVGTDRMQEGLREPFVLEDGCIRLPDGPGLGIDLDEDALLRGTVELESGAP
jgi:D-galactarolactone cycloisomerase